MTSCSAGAALGAPLARDGSLFLRGVLPRDEIMGIRRQLLALADKGAKAALGADAHLRNGLNVHRGKLTMPAVAQAQGLPFVAAERALAE